MEGNDPLEKMFDPTKEANSPLDKENNVLSIFIKYLSSTEKKQNGNYI